MVGKLIVRGIVVGILAGLIAFSWARVVGEPALEAAIAFESAQAAAEGEAHAHTHAHSHSHAETAAGPAEGEPEGFSRSVQSGIGLLTGSVAIGASLGGLFAIFFAYAYGRMGSLGPGPISTLLAFLGLLSFYLVPWLKYPASPPGVGAADSIQLRTGLYFLMVAISIAATLGGLALRQRLSRSYGQWNGSLMAVGAYLLVIFAAFVVLPGFDEVPATFPANTLWEFRLASLGMQTVLWMSLGVMYGYVGGWTLHPPVRPGEGL